MGSQTISELALTFLDFVKYIPTYFFFISNSKTLDFLQRNLKKSKGDLKYIREILPLEIDRA